MDGDGPLARALAGAGLAGAPLEVGGAGPPVLLLPALSSVSTRAEMAPLAGRLRAAGFATVAADWPGFGTGPAPARPLEPADLRGFLDRLVGALMAASGGTPPGLVAAGHGAGHALAHAAREPAAFGPTVLVAPTWRGPLPTMSGGPRPFHGRVRRLVEGRVLGPALYALNLSPPVVRLMAREHVMGERAAVTRGWLDAKRAVIRRPNARFATAAFVTGALDPFADRAAFLEAAGRVAARLLVVIGGEGPAGSLAEMEALAALPGVRAARLPRGKLGLHEEHPDAVAAVAVPHLRGAAAGAGAAA